MKQTTIKLAALCAALLAASFAAAQKSRDAAQTRQPAQKIDAARLFAKNCATCHGKDGRAKTLKSKLHVHARNLTDPAWQSEATDERIRNSITNGRGKMPAFGRKLTSEEIGALAAYVRGLKR